MQKNELEQLLRDIDEEASLALGPRDCLVSVVIVGGSAFMLRDLTARPATHDIDVLSADSSVRAILSRYPNVNGMVSAHADEIPYNFEDRLVRILPATKTIAYWTPSLEDLVVIPRRPRRHEAVCLAPKRRDRPHEPRRDQVPQLGAARSPCLR